MVKMDVSLIGDGYTQEQSLALKAEVIAWASTNGLKGAVHLIEQLQ